MITNNTIKWDERFLNLAREVSKWSKDPSTKVGSVIIRPDKSVCSVGYNGFPKKCKDRQEDYDNRDIKIKKVVHAERNAILFANEPMTGYTIYTWPFLPCTVCAGMIIQKDISRVVCPRLLKKDDHERYARWEPDFIISREMFAEAGIEVVEYNIAVFRSKEDRIVITRSEARESQGIS